MSIYKDELECGVGKAFAACIRLLKLVHLGALCPFFAYAKKLGERKKRKGHRKVPFSSCLVCQKCFLAFTWKMHSRINPSDQSLFSFHAHSPARHAYSSFLINFHKENYMKIMGLQGTSNAGSFHFGSKCLLMKPCNVSYTSMRAQTSTASIHPHL